MLKNAMTVDTRVLTLQFSKISKGGCIPMGPRSGNWKWPSKTSTTQPRDGPSGSSIVNRIPSWRTTSSPGLTCNRPISVLIQSPVMSNKPQQNSYYSLHIHHLPIVAENPNLGRHHMQARACLVAYSFEEIDACFGRNEIDFAFQERVRQAYVLVVEQSRNLHLRWQMHTRPQTCSQYTYTEQKQPLYQHKM